LWSNWWNEDWQGKPKYSEKTFPSATLSTTNPRLSYGAANVVTYSRFLILKAEDPEDGGSIFV
jgi:hypothetical protein